MNYKKIFSNYTYILTANIATVIAVLLVMKVAKTRFIAQDFNNIVLTMRYTGVMVPLLVFGMAVATPKYIGSIVKDIHQEKSLIIGAALIVILTTVLLYLIFSFTAYRLIDQALFDGNKFYIFSIIYFVSMTMYGFSYSILRGLELFNIALITEFIVRIITPVFFVYYFNDSPSYIIGVSSITFLTALFIIIKNTKIDDIKPQKSYFSFGIGRVFGDILFPLIITAPVLFMLHFQSDSSAAKLSVTIMVMNALLMPISPVSVLILPKVNVIFSHLNNRKLNIYLLLFIINAIALIVSLTHLLIAEYGWAFFGYQLDNSVYYLSCILYFNIVFVMCRSLIDGYYLKPYLFYYILSAAIVELIGILYIYHINRYDFTLVPLVASYFTLYILVSRKLLKNNNPASYNAS